MDNEELVIDTKDYRGERVIFTKKRWENKSSQHPELKFQKFLRNVRRAIENPMEVWEDYSEKKKRHCYYLEVLNTKIR